VSVYDYYRRFLFQLPPEQAHRLAIALLKKSWVSMPPLQPAAHLQQTIMGLSFAHPIGLAAGFDKDGEALSGLAQCGFSHIECGTVTPLPQTGNSSPRLFRLPSQSAIINRMGFNNAGVMALAKRLERRPSHIVLGVNIGKNKHTPIAEAANDYLFCYRVVYPYADYVTINLSSPNTEKLRDLQAGEALEPLVSALKDAQSQLATQHGRYVPIAVKIAPDLHEQEIATIARVVKGYQLDAVVATNTTIERTMVSTCVHGQEAGGLSGIPLQEKSTAAIRCLRQHLGDKIPLIGVGGIADSHSAQEKLDAGANLLQLYTALVYQGPEILAKILSDISVSDFP
jgi:dihydroorotate dehydrogenase